MPSDARRAIETWTRLRLAGGDPGPAPDRTPPRLRAALDRASADARTRDALDRSWASLDAANRILADLSGRPRTVVPTSVRLRQLARAQESLGPHDQAWVARWRRHVEELARAAGARIEYGPAGTAPRAWALWRVIWTDPIVSAWSYSSGLHELGHVVCRSERHQHRTARINGDTVVRPEAEVCAWTFARTHARPAWTRTMASNCAEALHSYRKHATPDEWIAMRALLSRPATDDV